MKELLYQEFISEIAKDYKINPNKEVKRHVNNFPLKKGKRQIVVDYKSVIIDVDGNEYPYMIDGLRNKEAIVKAVYIKSYIPKYIHEIEQESGIRIKKEKCRICEGGGWYSQGMRYTYKEFYCEC